MDIDIQFDHTSHLSLSELQLKGIRSTKALEQVFRDANSVCYEITKPTDTEPVFFMIGFSSSMLPLLYVFTFSQKITSLYARIASVEDIKRFFCS